MRKKKGSKKGSRLGLLFVIALLVYFSFILYDQQKMLVQKNKDTEAVKARITEEQKTKEKLEREKSTINSDEYIEKIARDELGYMKDGDKRFEDVDNK